MGARTAGPGRGHKTARSKRPPPGEKLTELEKRFCFHCIDETNRSEAYRKAGGTAKHPDNSALVMMRRQRVVDEIDRLQRAQFARLEMKSDEALALAAAIARACAVDLLAEDGSIKPPTEWGKDLRVAVVGFEVEELFAGKGENRAAIGTVLKPKLADKIAALTLIMRKHGLLKEKVEHSADESFAGLVMEAARIRKGEKP